MAPASIQQANVKSVLSGDTLILTAPNNPKSERILSLACVDAPRMKREADEVYFDCSSLSEQGADKISHTVLLLETFLSNIA